MRYVIGLDIGTTCIKALLFDESGNIVGASSADDELYTPQKDWAEQDARRWIQLSSQVIRGAVAQSGVESSAIKALSIASQGITLVPVDEKYQPLRSAINWLDQRGQEDVSGELDTLGADKVYRITGKCTSAGYTLSKLVWLKNHQPELYRKTYKMLLPHDYVIAHFTGAAVTDHTMASATMLYDIARQDWSDEILALFGIDKALLPRLMWAGEPVGELTESAAAMLGLPRSVLVVTGGQDQKVAAGAARLMPGSATVSMGTCNAYTFLFDKPPYHPARKLPAFSYLQKGMWELEGCASTTGAAIKWARGALMPHLSYDGIDKLADIGPGAGGVMFYPYLCGAGSPHNQSADGVFTGLTLGAGMAHLARAVLEGIGFESRLNLDAAEEAGVSIKDISVFGGVSKSAIVNRIIADVTGRRLKSYNCSEMASFGAAALAASAIGISGFGQAILDDCSVWNPNEANTALYEKIFADYVSNLELIFQLKKEEK